MVKLVFFLLGVLILSSCASMNVGTRNIRHVTSEANGGLFELELKAGYSRGQYVCYSHDVALTDPETDAPMIIENDVLNTTLSIGLHERIDISIFKDSQIKDLIDFFIPYFTSDPVILEAKIQLLGSPRTQRRAGNFSLSTTLAYGSFSKDQEINYGESNKLLFKDIVSHFEYKIYDIGLITGYRIFDKVLLYGGAFYTYYPLKGDYQREGQEKESFESKITTNGLNLGLSFDMTNWFFLRLEVDRYNTKSKDLSKNTFHVGSSLGFVF